MTFSLATYSCFFPYHFCVCLVFLCVLNCFLSSFPAATDNRRWSLLLPFKLYRDIVTYDDVKIDQGTATFRRLSCRFLFLTLEGFFFWLCSILLVPIQDDFLSPILFYQTFSFFSFPTRVPEIGNWYEWCHFGSLLPPLHYMCIGVALVQLNH
jgi:hypothetical protein